MTATSVALARAASALVRPHDTTDLLATLLADAVRPLGAAGGLVLIEDTHELELLAATSHRAREVELSRSSTAADPAKGRRAKASSSPAGRAPSCGPVGPTWARPSRLAA